MQHIDIQHCERVAQLVEKNAHSTSSRLKEVQAPTALVHNAQAKRICYRQCLLSILATKASECSELKQHYNQTVMSCSLYVYRLSGELMAQWRDLLTTQAFEDLNVSDVIGATLFRILRDGRPIQLRGHIFDSEDQTVDLQVVIFGSFDVKGYFSNRHLPIDVFMPELSGRIEIKANVHLGDVCEQLIERLFNDNSVDTKLKSRLNYLLRSSQTTPLGISVYELEALPFVNVDHPDGPQASIFFVAL